MLLAGVVLAGCVPNPRNEIPAVLAAAVAELAEKQTAPSCVEREVRRLAATTAEDAPSGFSDLLASRFRGGGGIKGAAVAGVPIRHHPTCHQLYGPVIADDRALVRAEAVGEQVDVWLRRSDERWHASTSVRRVTQPMDSGLPVGQ